MLSDQSVRLIDIVDKADLSSPGTKRVRGGRESPNHIDRDRRTRHDTKFPTRHIPSHSLILAAGESTEAPRRVARTGAFPRARQEPVEGSPIRSSSGQLRSLLSYSGGLTHGRAFRNMSLRDRARSVSMPAMCDALRWACRSVQQRTGRHTAAFTGT